MATSPLTRRKLLAAALAPARRPNVLFLAVDDLRPELGAYGSGIVKSPRIDALARSGTMFTRAYCQEALCNPSRASLLTGLRPDTLRVWDLQTDFRQTTPAAVTLPQYLKSQGYFTTHIGKIFHNVLPDPASWSEPWLQLPGFPYDPDAVYRSAAETTWLDQRKQEITAAGHAARHIDSLGQWYLKGAASESPDVPDNAYYDGAQTDAAITKLSALRERQQPFFFGVGYYRPHLPFNAPRRYWDLYDPARLPLSPQPRRPRGAPLMAGNTNRELRGYRDFARAPRPAEGALPEADARRLRHGYLASVSYIDAQIGRLLDELDRLDLTRNTIVVLWGDHGWKLGDHNSWGKMTNYEVDTRVPLIIRAPGMRPGVARGLVELVDVYPTLAALTGLPQPAGLAGTSLVPQLRQPQRPGKSAVYSQFLRNGIWTAPDGREYMGYAIRTERFRYVEWVHWPTRALAARELYDLASDPLESENRSGLAGLAGEEQKLAAQLRAHFPSRAGQSYGARAVVQ
jgi:iduronate 2-sulfatase